MPSGESNWPRATLFSHRFDAAHVSQLWRYGEGVVTLLALFGAVVASASTDAGELATIGLVMGLPLGALAAVKGLKRAMWDGSNGICAECGTTVRSYQEYCTDCEPGYSGGSI